MATSQHIMRAADSYDTMQWCQLPGSITT